MTDFRYVSTILPVLMALVPVVIVVASVLFRTGRRTRGAPGRRNVSDRDGE